MKDLLAIISAELSAAPPEAVRSAAARLAAASEDVAAVLFYGSALRAGESDTLLDFYVLVDGYRGWRPRGVVQAAAGVFLPPNVEHWSFEGPDGRPLGAKVAVVRLDQFESRMGVERIDTTFWARFAQPAMLAWSRDDIARRRVETALTGAVRTAARWAAVLGPESGEAADYWTALFRETYATELRVERGDRAAAVVAARQERFERVLAPAWKASGLQPVVEHGLVQPGLSAKDRAEGRRRWRYRRLLGRPLNVLRLIKAAFTFHGGAEYLVWKIERHTRTEVPLTDWQRRHPILAAPAMYRRLKRQGVIR